MPDYSKGKIYTIRCHSNPDYIYVGSTIQSLAVRLGGHKVDSMKYINRLIYSTINNDWTDWYIELYENYPCENREQLDRREGEVIREISTLNKRIEGRTQKEYRKENAEKIKERLKKYHQANSDKIKEQRKEYCKNNADKIREKKKIYYQANIEKITEQKKECRQRKKAEKHQNMVQ